MERSVTPAVTLGPDTVDTASASEASGDLSQKILPSGLQLLQLLRLDDRLPIFDAGPLSPSQQGFVLTMALTMRNLVMIPKKHV